MKVSHIIEKKGRNVVTISRDAPLVEAARLLWKHNIGAVIVTNEDGGIAGILSERDIVLHLAEQGDHLKGTMVKDVMTADIHTCKSSDSVTDVMKWMTRYRTRHLPVVDDGGLHGIISIGDVVKHRLTEIETEKNVLRDIIVGKT